MERGLILEGWVPRHFGDADGGNPLGSPANLPSFTRPVSDPGPRSIPTVPSSPEDGWVVDEGESREAYLAYVPDDIKIKLLASWANAIPDQQEEEEEEEEEE